MLETPPPTKPKSPPAQRDKTLRKGLHILEILMSKGTLSLREIAANCGLKKGNTHQILQTLLDEGYAKQDSETSHYSATLKFWEIGMQYYEQLDLVGPCLEAMKHLNQTTRETVNLSILDGREVVYLHKIDSLEAVRSFTCVGGRAPAHCVATGKAILAFDARGEKFWRSLDLSSFSDTTIIDPDDFIEEMLATKERGWSINRGEWRGAVWGVAAPILGWHGRARLAIGVAGPGERLSPGRLDEIGPVVVAAAAQAAEAFGGFSVGT